MNLELLKHAKDYIEKMANGINPLTGESVKDDDLINNIKISRCLFYVNGVLGEVISNGGVSNKKNNVKKLPFTISKEEISNFIYSDEDLSISKIVKQINELNTNENTYKLKATDVCNWLISIGLMIEGTLYGRKVKRPTETGISIGMYLEHRFGAYGEYDNILYKKSAQKFIIDNFDCLLEFLNQQ